MDYKWTEIPPDELVCSICHLVARNPRQHAGDGCGRMFCEACVAPYQEQEKCPACMQALTLSEDVKSKLSHLMS